MTALKRASGAQALTGPLHCCHPTPHGRLRHDELRDLNQSNRRSAISAPPSSTSGRSRHPAANKWEKVEKNGSRAQGFVDGHAKSEIRYMHMIYLLLPELSQLYMYFPWVVPCVVSG